MGMTSSLVLTAIHWTVEKMASTSNCQPGGADIKRHGVLIAAAIFSKVLTRISCATPCAERLA
jgi:hypothetical protein